MDTEGAQQIELLPADAQAESDAPAEAPKKRITTPYMTKYERARVIGTRALQIRYVISAPRAS